MFKNIKTIKEEHEKEILQKRGVVGVGLGRKITGGKQVRKKAIIVLVEKKKPLYTLEEKDKIPKKIEGKLSDVLEVGILEPMHKKKHRPLVGGCSAAWYRLTACTAGVKVYKNRKPYLLQNAHCGFPFWNGAKKGDAVLNPSPSDGGKIENKIGEVYEHASLSPDKTNTMDAY